MNSKQNILIISYYFAPRNVIGAVRSTKIAKYLQRDGYNVDVITLKCDDENIDGILENDINGINVYYLEHSKTYMYLKTHILDKYLKRKNILQKEEKESSKSKDKFKTMIKTLINFALSIYQSIDFNMKAKKVIKELLKEKKYTSIYCTYGPLPNLFVIRWMMHKYSNEKYVIDFRDPVTINGSKNNKWMTRYFNKLVSYIVNKSDCSIGVTNGISNYLTDISKKEAITIYNGFDKEDIKEIIIDKSKNKKIEFSYTGSLYRGKRDLSILFKCIDRIINEGIVNIEDVSFNYAGEEINELLFQTQKYKLEEIVSYKGNLTRRESLTMQMNSDICIVCTWNNKDELGVIPGKLYETMMIKNPVIGIVCGDTTNSEIKSIIEKNNLGFCYEEAEDGSYNKLYKYILEYIKQNEKYSKNIQEFDYKNITKKYEEIFKLVSKRE